MRHAFLGPRWSADAVAGLLAATGLPAADFRGREAELLEAVVDRLVRGEVVGWFHGALELGARALGARSLLADPRDPGMRDRLNHLVKKREAFRPFAPSVLAAHAAEHFALDHPSPFMLETCAVTSPLELPAITHVDGSAKPSAAGPAARSWSTRRSTSPGSPSSARPSTPCSASGPPGSTPWSWRISSSTEPGCRKVGRTAGASASPPGGAPEASAARSQPIGGAPSAKSSTRSYEGNFDCWST
jgi:hypothetical protein